MRERKAQQKFAAVRMGQSEEQARKSLFRLGLLALFGALFISLLPFQFRDIPFDAAIDRFLNAPGIDPLRWYNDQWTGHTVAYTLVGFLLAAGLMRGRAVGWIVGAGTAFGLCLVAIFGAEIAQGFVVGRGVTANDVAAGVVGAGVGIMLWALFGRDILRFAIVAGSGGPEALRAGAALFAVAYGVFLLFPFDLALSGHEVSALIAEGKPLLGLGAGGDGVLRLSVRALFEVAAAAPLGLLVVHWRDRRAAFRVVLLALAIGFGVEIVQFFVKTGQSTLLSALTRSLGVFLGWRLIEAVRMLDGARLPSESRLRGIVKILALIASPLYVLLLVALDGWQKGAPIGVSEAIARLGHVNWLPFFYHYQGDEVSTMVSALATVALFLPAGALVWAVRGITVRRPIAFGAGALAALLAAAVEMGGLIMGGLRPDPTNIWLAAVGGALGGAGAAGIWRWLWATMSKPAEDPFHTHIREDMGSPGPRHVIAGLILLASVLTVFGFPAANGWILGGLAAYGVLLWRQPSAWLIVVPAALPVLDFSVLSGRDFLDCFDTLLMVTVAILLIRRPPRGWDVRLSGPAPWLIGALVVSYVISVMLGLFPLPPYDANFWTSPWGTPQTLKVAKGFFWALALYPFLARFLKNDPRGLLLFAYGMIAGLALTIGVVLWERFLFTGLFNVSRTDYRVVGAFTTMRTGGAHIDAYLATVLPFLAVLVMASERLVVRLGAAALLAGGLYAVFVTFSRGPYLAVLAAALVLGATVWVASRGRGGNILRFAALGIVGFGLLGAAAIPFLSDSFLAKRFERLGEDSGIRFSHWSESLEVMDDSLTATLFGMGPGRFPDVYRERNPEGQIMAMFRLNGERGQSYITLTAGRSLFLSQFIRVRPHTDYSLRFLARSSNERATLTIPICEKWVTDSFQCAWQSLRIGDTGGEWKEIEHTVDMGKVGGPLGRTGWIGARPVKLSLYYPTRGAGLDVTDIRLLDPAGYNRIDNGSFARGLDFWYFTVDDHLAWHIKNLFVGLYFDQGLVGLVLFAALLTVVIARLLRQIMAGERFSAVLLASLTGFMVVGIIGSLFDAPRMTLMLYLVLFTSLLTGEMMARPTRGKASAPDNSAGPAQDSA